MSTFRSLYTVRSGLDAARRALDVVGRNVANANTAGYSRQEVSFVAAEPSQVITSAGRGISEVNVLRYRDEFLDRQFRFRSGMQGYHDTRSQQLAQVEQVLGDLSEGGLRTALDNFFNAWGNLAVNPGLPHARGQVISAAEEFLALASTSFNELAQLRTNVDEALQNKVAEINNAAAQIAELNQAISTGKLTQEETSELMDRRDMLLDSLAQMAGATSVRQSDGTVTVHIGSLPLVERSTAHPLDVTVALESDMDPDPTLTSAQQNLASFTWNGTAVPVAFLAGEMAALLEMRDQTIPDYMKSLDSLVRSLATEVNALHTADSDGDLNPDAPEFFTIGPNWMAVSVNAAIKADPSQILAAATLPAGAGDGERARAIAGLRDAKFLTGGPVGIQQSTPGQFLRAIFTQVGLQVQEATRRSEAAALQTGQADRYRQSVSGVSLDDEMTKMIQFQQAYNASARMMTTIDEMLDVMINRIGLVGR